MKRDRETRSRKDTRASYVCVLVCVSRCLSCALYIMRQAVKVKDSGERKIAALKCVLNNSPSLRCRMEKEILKRESIDVFFSSSDFLVVLLHSSSYSLTFFLLHTHNSGDVVIHAGWTLLESDRENERVLLFSFFFFGQSFQGKEERGIHTHY